MISTLTHLAARLLFLAATLDDRVVLTTTLDRAVTFGAASVDRVLVFGATLG